MFKKLLSSVVAVAMLASTCLISQVSAKQTSTTLINGVPEAGQTSKYVGDYQINIMRVGKSTLTCDGSKMVFTGGADYDVTESQDSCGPNYFRACLIGNVTPETLEESVYYEWTINCSASPAFLGVYNKDSAGSWGVYPGRINYRVAPGENHLWNTSSGGSIPVGKDFTVGLLYDVVEGTWTLYIDGNATKKTGAVKDADLGIGQCWLEGSMMGASDTLTIKDMAMYNFVTEPSAEGELLSGNPINGLSKIEGGVSYETLRQGTSTIVNRGGNIVMTADCSQSTANYTRIYLNTSVKTTGYIWYQYTVNMSEIPSLIAINARGTGNGPWQYAENLNYQKSNSENHILRTTGQKIVPGQDYTFGFLVDLDNKTYTITQDGVGTRLSGNLYNPATDVGIVYFETQMNSATATMTVKDVNVKYFSPAATDATALFSGLPILGLTKTMNGITLQTVCTETKGATMYNPFNTIVAKATHVEDNSNYARIYLNGIINDSRTSGLYLAEFTVNASAVPRDLGFFSRANGSYPVRPHIMTANSDEEYATMQTTGEQYDPSKTYKFGFLYNAATGEYMIYQDGQPTNVRGKADIMDGSVRTMSDFFFEMQTASEEDTIEVTDIKVTEVTDMEFNKATFTTVDDVINASLNVSNAKVLLAGYDAEGKFVGYSSTSSFGPKTLTIPGAVDAKVIFLEDITGLKPIAPAQSYTK